MTAKWRALLLTARPKTLSAAVVPVAVGTALAYFEGHAIKVWVSVCALVAAVLIQIGTNFVNDALDFLKGADGDSRLGDARACQSGWFSARTVMAIAAGCFLTAVLCGIPLVWHGGWPIFWIGVISVAMGYAYTGGPWPLAYVGLGDLFVIIFFGLVAVGGVYFLQTGGYSPAAAVAGIQVGLLATVLIAINNLRDLDQDRAVNKKTLAVRLGPVLGRFEVVALFAVAFALNGFWLSLGAFLVFLLPFFAMPLALQVLMRLLHAPASREYNGLLARASLVHMLFGTLLSAGLLLD